MNHLYLYDFDGTLTNKDSLFAFLKHATSTLKYYLILIYFTPLFLLVKLKLLNAGEVKRKFIKACLYGKSKSEISQLSQSFLKKIWGTSFFKTNALDSLNKNKEKGNVYIVSASLDIWLKDIANAINVNLICTEADYQEAIFKGNFKTLNCNYDEKVVRVINEINLKEYKKIIYYGDSAGDLPMKQIVTTFNYKVF